VAPRPITFGNPRRPGAASPTACRAIGKDSDRQLEAAVSLGTVERDARHKPTLLRIGAAPLLREHFLPALQGVKYVCWDLELRRCTPGVDVGLCHVVFEGHPAPDQPGRLSTSTDWS
jgi:hypothetical protein